MGSLEVEAYGLKIPCLCMRLFGRIYLIHSRIWDQSMHELTAGSIYFERDQPGRKNTLGMRRRMATVFQDPLLLTATVFENVALGLRMRRFGAGEIDRRVKPWLSRLKIEHLALRRVRTLSGGEAQRTSLARAFVLNPDLLLLDEPFSPLDPIGRESLLNDLHKILRETGTTTVLVTHHRHEALMLADSVGVLNDGKLLQLGPAREVFMYPLTEKVAEIVGIENRVPGVVQEIVGDVVSIDVDSQTVHVKGHYDRGSRVVLCLRAEELTLSHSEPRSCAPANLNRLEGKIISVSPGTLHHLVTLQSGNRFLLALVPRNELLRLNLHEGDDVVVTFSAKSLHVIANPEF